MEREKNYSRPEKLPWKMRSKPWRKHLPCWNSNALRYISRVGKNEKKEDVNLLLHFHPLCIIQFSTSFVFNKLLCNILSVFFLPIFILVYVSTDRQSEIIHIMWNFIYFFSLVHWYCKVLQYLTSQGGGPMKSKKKCTKCNGACFLQALFGEKCKIFLENVASPNWRKLQSLDRQLFCQP